MSLTSKILVMSLLPLVIGGSAILIACFAFHKQALMHESEEHAQMQLERHTEAIRGFFDKAVTSLTVLSASRVLQEGRLPNILEQLRQWEPKLCDIEGLYYSEIDGIVHEPSGKTFSVADRNYSKIEAGKLEIESIDFDLREPVEEVMQLFAEKAQQKGVELVCHVSDEAPLPVIMLTSLNKDYDSETLHQTGISAYLTKPVRQSRLYNCIVAVARAVPDGDSPKSSGKSDLEEPLGFPGTQVLLAEDNPVNQVVAQHMLKGLGCRVEVVSNGQDAVEALSNVPFDLVLMDCQMPVLDGYTATRIIREKEAQDTKDPPQPRQEIRRIPIVALTAHAMQGDRERCIAAGMDDYLSKPFNLDGLMTVLKRWLPSKSMTEQPKPEARTSCATMG